MSNNQTQLLSEIQGHERIKEFLCMLARLPNMPQALAFVGPKGVGKSSLLKAWLTEILKINLDNKTDFSYLDPRSSNGIESLRQFLAKSSLSPVNSKYNLMLIDNADSLSRESANVLLKTLEEPPASALFFLICHSKNLPQTVFSRCLVVNFSKLKIEDLRQIAKSQNFNPSEEDLKLSGGSAGRLIGILASEKFKNTILPASLTLKKATTSHLSERLLALQELSELESEELEQVIWNFIYLIRQEDVLLSKLSILSKLYKALEMLRNNINKKLILQSILLKNL